ncbi:MAG: MBOAT family O-acyltransferase [Rhodopseudomonas sp.]|uniref:MBOAT family O-acyltransferase n=1 Tax=Rhodopseudomonas sp. TaxID=1078 RepID=UPI0039E68100
MLYFLPDYCLVFLPLTLILFFVTRHTLGNAAAKLTLIAGSLIFYGIWNLSSIPVLLASIVVNLCIVDTLFRYQKHRRAALIAGLLFNVSLLAFFKYANFAIENLNLLGLEIAPLELFLPLGISFFTFQKIALLVDVYKQRVPRPTTLNFALFVTFFPQLIAGPIVHHAEMMPQFDDPARRSFNISNFNTGIVLFCIGFIKKLLIADGMGIYANFGFSQTTIGPFDAWCTALSYTFQLYFDFSGFIDMGMGSAMMFNITLPQNFLSPYKSANIQEFWRRWHITLGRFLRDYIYIPLGGGRRRVYLNLMATFVIGGIWHGAAWTFVIWGLLHGTALCVHRAFQKARFRLPGPLGIILTFWFVVVGWVFFRATTVTEAWMVLKAMHDPHVWKSVLADPHAFIGSRRVLDAKWIPFAALCAVTCFAFPNTSEIMSRYRPAYWHIPALGVGTAAAVIFAVYVNAPPPFLYFNF